jgi:heat shock protein HslJ
MTSWIRTFLTGVLATAVLLSLASCGSADGGEDTSSDSADPGDPTTGTPPAGVADHDWVSTAVTKDDSEQPLVAGTRIELSFPEGQIAASAGCNSFSGTADWEGNTLVVTGMGGTEMGCDPKLMAQDEWLTGFLTSSPSVVVEDDRLTMTGGGTVVTFVDREVAIPDAALEGTTWVLDGIGTGGDDGAVSSVPAGVTSTLTIDGDKLGVQPGCNTGGGSVTVTDDTLDVGPIFTTKMFCGGARTEVEQTVLGVLTGQVDYKLDESTLVLTKGDTMLYYRAKKL